VKFLFKELPGQSEDYQRPAVPVLIEGLQRAPQLCLLDTGALHNRFGLWVAEAAGIELGTGDEQRIAVGGVVCRAREASVQLAIGNVTWEASVWFCDPWPMSFQLLGQEGFFRWFDVRIRAAQYTVEITAES
jgi:hypothetical protein